MPDEVADIGPEHSQPRCIMVRGCPGVGGTQPTTPFMQRHPGRATRPIAEMGAFLFRSGPILNSRSTCFRTPRVMDHILQRVLARFTFLHVWMRVITFGWDSDGGDRPMHGANDLNSPMLIMMWGWTCFIRVWRRLHDPSAFEPSSESTSAIGQNGSSPISLDEHEGGMRRLDGCQMLLDHVQNCEIGGDPKRPPTWIGGELGSTQ
jgi:hypothetical protein